MLLLKNKTPIESTEEAERMLREYKSSKDSSLLDKLIKQYEGLVYYISQRFRVSPSSQEDLIQVGYVGLLNAINRFEPKYNKDFLTFAFPTILGEMKRYLRDKTWDVKVPRRLQELGFKIQKTVDELTQELGVSPNISQIAERLNLSEDEITEAIAAGYSYDALSLDTPVNEDDDSGVNITDLVSREEYIKGDNDEHKFLSEALEKLTPEERKVIEWRFYDHYPQVEIAKKLGISQVQVSRLQRRALSKIKKELISA